MLMECGKEMALAEKIIGYLRNRPGGYGDEEAMRNALYYPRTPHLNLFDVVIADLIRSGQVLRIRRGAGFGDLIQLNC